MTKFSKFAVKPAAEDNLVKSTVVKNFMAGNSYTLNPLDTLRIVAASSIFGEPSYYRASEDAKAQIASKKLPQTVGNIVKNLATIKEYSIFADLYDKANTTDTLMANAIDAALTYDFKGTLDLAVELRKDYYMRLNPSVIFVRASLHADRNSFNESNPGYMRAIGKKIAMRPDDLTNQFEYFMYLNGSKNGLSSVVKRTWADAMQSFSRYQLNKYKGKKLIDLVRISHASSPDINELMKTGSLVMPPEDSTWETMRSAGKTWKEIVTTIKMPHMALLRNLRNIFTEVNDATFAAEILGQLKEGVLGGKQFAFRYWTAYQAISNESVNHKTKILDTLEECLDISVENMPKLVGKTMCLSDNSGSARGTLTTEYGSVNISEIGNLSSLISAINSDEGYVGIFGDRLSIVPVSKRNGILSQLKNLNTVGGRVGQGTENGVWLFWDEAMKKKLHYDNVFIYSDMQAGHGGLYGTPDQAAIYNSNYGHKNARGGTPFFDVLAMVKAYRAAVNDKINLFTVQTAGYNNSVLPENLYRGAILAGWTGKEIVYAKVLIDTWNKVESSGNRKVAKTSAKPARKVAAKKTSTKVSTEKTVGEILSTLTK